MTDKPELQPHSFSKRRTAGVPRLDGATPNLRSAPSVNTFAAQSQAEMFVNMAVFTPRQLSHLDNLKLFKWSS